MKKPKTYKRGPYKKDGKKRGPYKRAPGNETVRLSSILARIITSDLERDVKLKAIEALI